MLFHKDELLQQLTVKNGLSERFFALDLWPKLGQITVDVQYQVHESGVTITSVTSVYSGVLRAGTDITGTEHWNTEAQRFLHMS